MSYENELLNDIRDCESKIQKAEMLEKLERNGNFDKLITVGFLNDLPLNLLYESNLEDNEIYHQKLDAIKFFKNYLDIIKAEAKQAKLDIENYKQELININ